MLPKKTSLHFLYENRIGRLLFNEEGRSIWTGCRKPYREGVISLADQDPDLEKDELRSAYIKSIPRCKNYRGLLLQGYLISPKFMRDMPHFRVRPDDLFICSYPRSGTTWMEEIVSCVVTNFDKKFMSKKVHDRVMHLEAGRTFGQQRYLNKLKSPRRLGTHLPLSHCPDQLKDLNCKVIYVARNPKDQAVSYYYFHSTAKYLGKKKWDWDTFLRIYTAGHLVYGSWLDHVKDWYLLARERPDQVLFVTYEELQVNLDAMLIRIAEFVGIQLDPATVDQIARHCRFSQMKKNPAVNREEVPVTDLFVPTEFMRKGIIGDWKNHFSATQSLLFDQLYDQEMRSLGLEFAYDTEKALALANRGVVTASGPSRPLKKGLSEASVMSTSTELMIEQADGKASGAVVYRKSKASQTSETRMSECGGHGMADHLDEVKRRQPHDPADKKQGIDPRSEGGEAEAMPVEIEEEEMLTAVMTMMPPSDAPHYRNGAPCDSRGEENIRNQNTTSSSSSHSDSTSSLPKGRRSDDSYAVVTAGRNVRRGNDARKSKKNVHSDAAFDRVFPIRFHANSGPQP